MQIYRNKAKRNDNNNDNDIIMIIIIVRKKERKKERRKKGAKTEQCQIVTDPLNFFSATGRITNRCYLHFLQE